jgi:hypothetical protein
MACGIRPLKVAVCRALTEIFLKKLEINEEEAPINRRTDREIVFRSFNKCPTLEACKI